MNLLPPIIVANNISVGYGHKTILQDISFSIYPGDMVCLMGHNGCGKTTILRTLAGFQKPLQGDLLVKDKEILSWSNLDYAKITSVVLTDRVEGRGLTVYDVVKLGRYPYLNFLGQFSTSDKQKTYEAIEIMGLADLMDKEIDELSDGQRQKVFIARALAQDTEILLLDEPTTFLDLPGKMEILRILKKISREKKVAILFSSHDWQLTLELVSWIWLINPSGTLKAGVPEDFILSGDFEKCFHHPEFSFSDELGFFKQIKRNELKVVLIGEENKIKIWTRHLLRKESFKVCEVPTADCPIVEIGADKNNLNYWTIIIDNINYQANNLEDLLVILKTKYVT